MSSTNPVKKTYTIPVLLIILVLLMTFVIILYSKYLLTQQMHATDRGEKLAQRYKYALVLFERVRDGSDSLLNAKTEAERLSAAKLLGEASLASEETVNLFAEAAEQGTSSLPTEEAAKPIQAAMNILIGPDSPLIMIGGQGGSLRGTEEDVLVLVRDESNRILEVLQRYQPPTSESGYRQMIALEEWRTVATEAGDRLENLASELNEMEIR